MVDDGVFRLMLLAGFAAVLPFALYFRIRSQRTREVLDRTQEGVPLMILLRLFGIGAVASAVAFAVDPTAMEWSRLPFPAWLRWCGVPISFAAGALLIWTFRTLGPNLTDTVVTRKEHELVTDGPYRWVRHPFYVAFLLTVLGSGLVTSSGSLIACGSVAFLLVVARTPIEERKLIERFGDDYRDLMGRTHRFVPRFPKG